MTRVRERQPEVELHERPAPDEAPLEPATRRLSLREWPGVIWRAGKKTMRDDMPLFASALAYNAFLAIPSVLLVALGLFTLLAGPQTIDTLIHHLAGVMPAQSTDLLRGSLHRLDRHHSQGLVLTIVGLVLAVWSVTGAMSNFMTAVTRAYDREDHRGFVRKRLTALVMAACVAVAFALVAVLVILGPPIEHAVGNALGIEGVLKYVWWSAQWPIVVGGLLLAFAALLRLGPDIEQSRRGILTLGSALAVGVWIATSLAFAVYTSQFSSYNKTWGSLAAVIIMLTWLWLSSLALLFGAETNAEADRTRARRQTT
jgi:membrane protein